MCILFGLFKEGILGPIIRWLGSKAAEREEAEAAANAPPKELTITEQFMQR